MASMVLLLMIHQAGEPRHRRIGVEGDAHCAIDRQ
jgi:hypothetical protein